MKQSSVTFASRLPKHQAANNLKYAIVFICVLIVLTTAFIFINQYWTIYSILMGVIFGLFIGYILLLKIPNKIQMAGFGIIAGMGIDFISSTSKNETPSTAINSLANSVSEMVNSIMQAASSTGLPSPSKIYLSTGIWVFFAVIGIVLLVGSIETKSEPEK